jgi:hypothetical protein
MEIKTAAFVGCLAIAMCLVTANALPAGELNEPQHVNEEERRATWLETRNLEENFKELVYLSLQELASEGLVNADLITGQQADKRGRHQGFCFRKTKSGRFLPYICWKGEGEQEEK